MPGTLYSGELARLFIAIAAGAGVAVGLCAVVATRRKSLPKSEVYLDEVLSDEVLSDQVLRLEPLLDRVERLERRSEADAVLHHRFQPEADRLSARLGALESALTEHSTVMEAMRLRAAETDACIQRLASAIDRLCDHLPQASLLPFEMQLSEAACRQKSEEPRVRVIKESEPKGSRSPLARIFPFALLAALSARFGGL